MPVNLSPDLDTRLFALLFAASAFDTPSFAVRCAASAFDTPSFAVRWALSAAFLASTPLS